MRSLNLRGKYTTIPHRKPSTALDPVSETTAYISITNVSFDPISSKATASSIP